MVDENDCLFCRIVKGEIPAKKVHEDENSIAFLDINPRNPGHTLVIPKEHYGTVFDMPENEAGEYFKSVKKVAEMVKKGVNAQGISIASSNGEAAGQVVAHLHFHVIPRFSTEGPVGLEGIIPTKRLDDKTMNQIVDAIKKTASGFQPRPKPEGREEHIKQMERAPERRPSMNDMPRPTPMRREQPPAGKEKKDMEEELDDEEIEFDF